MKNFQNAITFFKSKISQNELHPSVHQGQLNLRFLFDCTKKNTLYILMPHQRYLRYCLQDIKAEDEIRHYNWVRDAQT